jgi:predicted outer membrane repeat protein
VQIANTLFADNHADMEGGAIFAQQAGTWLALENCTFRENEAQTGAGLLVAGADALVISSEFSGNYGSSGAFAYGVLSGGTVTSTWSNYWSSGFLAFSPFPGPVGSNGNVSVNPSYLDPLWDGVDPSGGHLLASSPIIDLGDPAAFDPDGTRADIGFLGGSGAAYFDLDLDGAPMWWQPGAYDSTAFPALGLDCDDLDPATGPFAGCGL